MIARFGGAIGFSIIVTFGLFFLMQLLVASGKDALSESKGTVIDINIEKPDESIRKKQQKMPDRPEETPPPPPPAMAAVDVVNPNANADIGINIGRAQIDKVKFSGAISDRDVQPIVRIPPQYPVRAAERGIEGYVDLIFDINKTGNPFNVRVAFSTSSLFERSAIRAVEKWKYNPKIVDGQPSERFGVEVRITFELTK